MVEWTNMADWSCSTWGDGSSAPGTTNVVCVEYSIVIAKDVIVEDASRICAAVNAVAGISSEALETGVVGEMREALKAVVRALDAPEATNPAHRDYKNPAALAADRSIAEKSVRSVLAKLDSRP